MMDVTARRVTVTGGRPKTRTTTIMPLEAACDLSISDLLHLLKEKLDLECTRLQESPLPPLAATASLESEVSPPESIDLHPNKHTWLWDLTVNPLDRKP